MKTMALESYSILKRERMGDLYPHKAPKHLVKQSDMILGMCPRMQFFSKFSITAVIRSIIFQSQGQM